MCLPASTANRLPAKSAKGPGKANECHAHRVHGSDTHELQSPEDQEILEAAYKHDPKPDKTARMSLVERVSLGEKEVQVRYVWPRMNGSRVSNREFHQIWFQNRRQSSRRRSRPLLPHEIAEYHRSRDGASTSAMRSSQDVEGLVRYESGMESEESRLESPEILNGHDAPNVPAAEYQSWTPTPAAPPASKSQAPLTVPSVTPPSHPAAPDAATSAMPPMSSAEVRAPIGYIANRRSMSALRQSFPGQSSPASVWPERSDRSLKRVSSCVRLSMNAEGKAEIVTKDASSPSPPRPKQALILPEVALHHTTTPNFPSSQGLQRSASRRSRDSRSWEFWCDKESRSELESTAEKAASGSAAGAIGLLRTASGRNILGAVSTKRNSAFSNHMATVKRSKLGQRKPLQRASTSLGRLQSKHGHLGACLPKLKHSGSAASLHIKGNESDKENWSPERGSDFDAEETDGELGRRDVAAQGQSRSRTISGRKRQPHNGENDPEADAELSEFMRGGRKNDDLDCVQGLLSLSQGNWK